jgi:uncharacterized protein (TIGR02246 family)
MAAIPVGYRALEEQRTASRSLEETMKMRFVATVTALVISFAMPIFAQQKNAIDPKIEQQIHLLAMKYDQAINSHDPVAIAALYAQNAVWFTYHDGSYHGRQAIENEYAKMYFKRWNKHNYATTVARVTAVGNEVRATGTWTCDYSEATGDSHPDHGDYWWVIVREGDTWKIRKDTMTGTAWTAFGTNPG